MQPEPSIQVSVLLCAIMPIDGGVGDAIRV